MIDSDLLKTKMQADHAGKSEEDTVSALNVKDIPDKQPIESSKIKERLFILGCWVEIKRSRSESAEAMIDGLVMFPQIDIKDSAVELVWTKILDGLVADTEVPSFKIEHKTEILSMGDILVNWGEKNFGRDVLIKDVVSVKRLEAKPWAVKQ